MFLAYGTLKGVEGILLHSSIRLFQNKNRQGRNMQSKELLSLLLRASFDFYGNSRGRVRQCV
jgi:hypothetical protein